MNFLSGNELLIEKENIQVAKFAISKRILNPLSGLKRITEKKEEKKMKQNWKILKKIRSSQI